VSREEGELARSAEGSGTVVAGVRGDMEIPPLGGEPATMNRAEVADDGEPGGDRDVGYPIG
jgi:hypothetical protein